MSYVHHRTVIKVPPFGGHCKRVLHLLVEEHRVTDLCTSRLYLSRECGREAVFFAFRGSFCAPQVSSEVMANIGGDFRI